MNWDVTWTMHPQGKRRIGRALVGDIKNAGIYDLWVDPPLNGVSHFRSWACDAKCSPSGEWMLLHGSQLYVLVNNLTDEVFHMIPQTGWRFADYPGLHPQLIDSTLRIYLATTEGEPHGHGPHTLLLTERRHLRQGLGPAAVGSLHGCCKTWREPFGQYLATLPSPFGEWREAAPDWQTQSAIRW